MKQCARVCVSACVLTSICRDGLVEVLRSMLSMHLSPLQPEEDELEADGGADGIEGAPRVLTLHQVCRFATCALLTCRYDVQNVNLRTIFHSGVVHHFVQICVTTPLVSKSSTRPKKHDHVLDVLVIIVCVWMCSCWGWRRGRLSLEGSFPFAFL